MEKVLYRTGDCVSSSGVSPYKFSGCIIEHSFFSGSYAYYNVRLRHDYVRTFRASDLTQTKYDKLKSAFSELKCRWRICYGNTDVYLSRIGKATYIQCGGFANSALQLNLYNFKQVLDKLARVNDYTQYRDLDGYTMSRLTRVFRVGADVSTDFYNGRSAFYNCVTHLMLLMGIGNIFDSVLRERVGAQVKRTPSGNFVFSYSGEDYWAKGNGIEPTPNEAYYDV